MVKVKDAKLTLSAQNPVLSVNTNNLNHATVTCEVSVTTNAELGTQQISIALVRGNGVGENWLNEIVLPVNLTAVNTFKNIAVTFTKPSLRLPSQERVYTADIGVDVKFEGHVSIVQAPNVTIPHGPLVNH